MSRLSMKYVLPSKDPTTIIGVMESDKNNLKLMNTESFWRNLSYIAEKRSLDACRN